ncbi:polymorphic toxin type 17 domain-containing protein [Streptomyces sp. NPDC016845]|uniref:polymorphic toxin type 17 domain-containing protein n=1 Tax=Streptomyces sp. NPDC016845 TaxID=3364972 RepID=UPI00378D7997
MDGAGGGFGAEVFAGGRDDQVAVAVLVVVDGKGAWSNLAKSKRLPTDGPVPFVPPKKWDPKRPQERGGGYKDRYGNIWTRAKDGKDEWDVQIPKGKNFEIFAGSKNQGKDYSHANISNDGHVTH